MFIRNEHTKLQGYSSVASYNMENTKPSITSDSVELVKNSSSIFIDTSYKENGFINRNVDNRYSNQKMDSDYVTFDEYESWKLIPKPKVEVEAETKAEPIYMEMSKNVDNVTNSYEVNYDDNTDSYLFDKSLSINNKKINFFVDLSVKEIKLIFSDLKNKNYDINKLKTINSSIEGFLVDVIEENIYETMSNDYFLSEKLELIDALSEIVSKNKKLKGSFKDNLIRSLSDVSLNELFSLCEEYEEQYEVEEFFLISRFIFRFIEDYNKLNNNKIKLNEDLKRGINAIILLKSLKFKDNNII